MWPCKWHQRAEVKRRYLAALQGAARAPSTSFGRAQRLGVRPVSGAFPRNKQFSADSSAIVLKGRTRRYYKLSEGGMKRVLEETASERAKCKAKALRPLTGDV